MDIKSKELSYALGFIWADGWIRYSKYHHEIRVECVSDDIEIIQPIFNKFADWRIYHRNRPNRRPQSMLALTTKEMCEFLIENEYKPNSSKPANSILSHIPEELKSYWFRGLIDGDGCWYHKAASKYSAKRQFSLTSNYEQDWSYFESLLMSFNIKYRIDKLISPKGHKCSRLYIENKHGFITLGNYIYSDFENYPMRT